MRITMLGLRTTFFWLPALAVAAAAGAAFSEPHRSDSTRDLGLHNLPHHHRSPTTTTTTTKNHTILDPSQLVYYPPPDPTLPTNTTGVLVLPGGGYGHVSLDFEGAEAVSYLSARGYHAWVLNYTVADYVDPASLPLYPVPLDEAREAVRAIRGSRAGGPPGSALEKLGVWGFSAGGHLAAVTATDAALVGDGLLDFAVLAYPVITMGDEGYTHVGSRENLIGEDPDEELVWEMSAENRVGDDTPPTFLFHTSNDGSVSVVNSMLFARAMADHGRQFEMLILPDGEHGLGVPVDDPERNWNTELDRWMKFSI